MGVGVRFHHGAGHRLDHPARNLRAPRAVQESRDPAFDDLPQGRELRANLRHPFRRVHATPPSRKGSRRFDPCPFREIDGGAPARCGPAPPAPAR
jgi:hypothetical protein